MTLKARDHDSESCNKFKNFLSKITWLSRPWKITLGHFFALHKVRHFCKAPFFVGVIFAHFRWSIWLKYLQRVSLEVSINWRYLHQDAGKTYSEYQRLDHTKSIQKQLSAGRVCFCGNWKPGFFPRIIFNWHTFSR